MNDDGLYTATVGAGRADPVQLLPSAVQRNGRGTEVVLMSALLLPQVRQPGADEGQRAVLRALLEANRTERSGHEAGESADA